MEADILLVRDMDTSRGLVFSKARLACVSLPLWARWGMSVGRGARMCPEESSDDRHCD